MTQELLNILNPVRRMKVEDFEKISLAIAKNDLKREPAISELDFLYKKLTKRYEAITSQPLTKAMFVCEVEKPKAVRITSADQLMPEAYINDSDEYTKAQSQLWFAGFEMKGNKIIFRSSLSILFTQSSVSLEYAGISYLHKLRVFDLITEIDRYNRTATTPINISFTENFANEILK